jgi:two-component system, OmpR family, heavy metal sensor histidine kinase CusS
MTTSLRLRLALWSAALAGGALLGFALLSSWLIYQARLDRLDARLERAIPFGRGGVRAMPRPPETTLARDLGLPNDEDVGLRVIDREGSVAYESPHWASLGLAGHLPPVAPGPWQGVGRAPRRLLTVQTDEGPWRVVVRASPVGQVAIAANLQPLHQEMGTLRRIYLITIPGLLLAIGGGAWGLAGRALRPVGQLSHTIDQVTAQGLSQRVPIAGDMEFEPLITAFNAMLERLERSFHQASRFSGDAAHELKTPLTVLQGELERAIQQVESGSATQQRLSRLLDQVSHLGSIVRQLLLLSLADAGQMSIQRQPIDFSGLVQDQLEDLALLAPDLTLTTAIEPGLTVEGDRALLIQVIQNLITNTAKYNLPQGWVRVEAQHRGQQVHLTLTNPTPVLLQTERDRLFERFYRGEPARAGHTDGLGLGLSLAREIVRAHGGDLHLGTTPPDQAQFCLGLPALTPLPQQE